MRHKKRRFQLNRTASHRSALMRNLAKSFILYRKIQTSVFKAKALKRFVEPLITLAKEDTLFNRRRVFQLLGLRFNWLTPKQNRKVKEKGDLSAYNGDRRILDQLFKELGPKFKKREGGYTRIVRTVSGRVGDCAPCCVIECVE